MGASGSSAKRPKHEEADFAAAEDMPVLPLAVVGDDSVRSQLVDRLCLGPTSRSSAPPPHPHWTAAPGPPGSRAARRKALSTSAVGTRVWVMEGGEMLLLEVVDGAPSAARPPMPPSAVAEDSQVLLLALADPAIPAARALSAQADSVRAIVSWAVACRGKLGLPPLQLRIVYCSRVSLGSDKSAKPSAASTEARLEAPPRLGATTIVPAGSEASSVASLPAPVLVLAEELGCPVHAVWIEGSQGINALVRTCAGSRPAPRAPVFAAPAESPGRRTQARRTKPGTSKPPAAAAATVTAQCRDGSAGLAPGS